MHHTARPSSVGVVGCWTHFPPTFQTTFFPLFFTRCGFLSLVMYFLIPLARRPYTLLEQCCWPLLDGLSPQRLLLDGPATWLPMAAARWSLPDGRFSMAAISTITMAAAQWPWFLLSQWPQQFASWWPCGLMPNGLMLGGSCSMALMTLFLDDHCSMTSFIDGRFSMDCYLMTLMNSFFNSRCLMALRSDARWPDAWWQLLNGLDELTSRWFLFDSRCLLAWRLLFNSRCCSITACSMTACLNISLLNGRLLFVPISCQLCLTVVLFVIAALLVPILW